MGLTSDKVRVYADGPSLARAAALLFVSLFENAVREKGSFSVLLSGGTTPLALYGLLSSEEFSGRVDWKKAHLFWGDERCVPPGSIDSNFNAANASFILKTDIPPENVHRIKGELAPDEAAHEYEKELLSFFGIRAPAPPPFDLALLGLGKDGHTLSLFPGTKALEERDRLVVANHVPQAGSWRVTLTFRGVQEARVALFLVTGRDKARAVKEALEGDGAPAARVRAKELLWLLDAGAAELLG